MWRALVTRVLGGPQFNARHWSNVELARICPLLGGAVVNISGGDDTDKQGRCYRDYFPQASSYRISNYGKPTGLDGEFVLDLEVVTLPAELHSAFDVVFTHTVLEHVFDVARAVSNLSAMSRDVVVTVVPFLQSFHTGPGYGDYWRFTPTAVSRLFGRHGLETLYVSWNEDQIGNLYVVHVCSRSPEKWGRIAALQSSSPFGPGTSRNRIFFGDGAIDQARIELRSSPLGPGR